jgi:hypothetical protein
MTALSIQPPYPIITDIDGQPLEDGYIWIGVANLPPIGNPIAVYWDAALTQPAALPVRTRGGYPVNAGTPARLYVGSDYSIQVQNKNGSVLYSAPQATERYGGLIISSADVSFLQAGSGAVVRTAQSKMRDVVSVKDFGAVGDGVADDTAAFAAAFASGVKYIYCGESETYKINVSLVAPTNYTDITLELNGSTLTSDNGTILEIQRYGNFVIQNGVFDGQLGSADYGIKVGFGVQQSSAGLALKNVRFNNFGTSCLHANKASYTTLENCLLYTYFGDAISGIWFSFLDTFGRYVGFDNCVNMTESSVVHFQSTHFFTETNVVAQTMVNLIDCDHFEFNDCTFEPQNTCSTAQVLITSSSTFSSDIHFTGCYWLGDINAARQADSIRTTGTVHRLRLIKNNFYIVDGGLGFYNLKIDSTGQAFEIWDCYQTSQYNDATRANMTILNNTSQELYRQNLGGLFLGNASANKGLFVNKADGTLANAGQLLYNDQWEIIVGGNGQVVFTNAGIRPYTDNAKTSGSASFRWAGVYGNTFYPGAGTAQWTSGTGSPESVVTAPVGSMYTRTDGGAGTTLYVKESGAGNTGWVAK